ncbi:MAG: AMP-binding protein [Deltaproteobacteria bacterium]|jgi:acyl-[acyl-carrier-protein]-phospholipid O-acyltransferase/long-chain-fatty-acid--[acyl-carrier-protein] ligase|nr:AMP-binding protein [Deltaproteobacteria bacterium]
MNEASCRFLRFAAKVSPSGCARLAKFLANALAELLFRPFCRGLELAASAAGPTLLIANRVSTVDALILGAKLTRPAVFFLDQRLRGGRGGWLLELLGAFHKIVWIDCWQPLGPQGLDEALAAGQLAVVYPEVDLEVGHTIVPVSEELAWSILEAGAPALWASLDGPQHSRWGRSREVFRRPPRRARVRLTIERFPEPLAPLKPAPTRRAGLREAAMEIERLLLRARFWARRGEFGRNLWSALLEAARTHGADKEILEDVERRPWSYRRLVVESRLFGRRLRELTAPGENVGLLLPSHRMTVAAMFGLWSAGRTPAFLNFSQGPTLLKAAVKTGSIGVVVSSRRFCREAGLEALVGELSAVVVFVEDLRHGFWARLTARLGGDGPLTAPNEPAAVLFTSGSEGRPKGVVHSHVSLLSNDYQAATILDLGPDDVIFNAMPLFHSMGLNLLLLFPILLGMKSFLYLSPLHARTIPRLVRETKATFLVASDTFANAWARESHDIDFRSLRFLLAGSERIKSRTHELWFKRFGVRIFEGYGVTEASPCICINNALHFRTGSCGRMLPGTQSRVTPVEGVAVGGVLHVKGPQVMLGYIDESRAGGLKPPPDGWHETGDVVEIDADGFVWIRGRRKRFAKIGGEMISLATVEEVANQVFPGRPQAVVALDDDRRGERLALITEDPNPDLAKLREAVRAEGLSELYCPKAFVRLEKIPLYPVGKIDMVQLDADVAQAVARGGLKHAADVVRQPDQPPAPAPEAPAQLPR